jgi:hypothetical protein
MLWNSRFFIDIDIDIEIDIDIDVSSSSSSSGLEFSSRTGRCRK